VICICSSVSAARTSATGAPNQRNTQRARASAARERKIRKRAKVHTQTDARTDFIPPVNLDMIAYIYTRLCIQLSARSTRFLVSSAGKKKSPAERGLTRCLRRPAEIQNCPPASFVSVVFAVRTARERASAIFQAERKPA
jgi:hypothetical protein